MEILLPVMEKASHFKLKMPRKFYFNCLLMMEVNQRDREIIFLNQNLMSWGAILGRMQISIIVSVWIMLVALQNLMLMIL